MHFTERACVSPPEHPDATPREITVDSGMTVLNALMKGAISGQPANYVHGYRVGVEDIPAPILGLDDAELVIVANERARDLLRLGLYGWEGQPAQAVLNFSCSLREELSNRDGGVHTYNLELWNEHGTPRPTTLTVRRLSGRGPLRYLCLISPADGAGAAGGPSSDQLAAMGQMIAGFAHEVRNPLAALKSIVEDLSAEPAAEEQWGRDISRLSGLIARIERLVRSSLRLVQPERPIRKEHDASLLVASALDLLGARLRTTPGGPIRVSCDAEAPTVVIDEHQMVQVLVILLENAIEAAGSADQVRVRIHDGPPEDGEPSIGRGGRVYVDIEDDGPGIPHDILSQIFNPFFTRKARGTGLGLSIALKLLRENQGRVRIRSTVGRGSVFSIELPGTG
ncbi:sensor histidine kinase [Sorangium sp. So ce426]|uniref:sensor histidine kinase n=1 Tax=unclassified Sorangium TaxID=2621164 RepID=UPI003F5B2534